MKHRSDAISKLLEGLDTIVAGHAKRTLEEDKMKKEEGGEENPIESTKDYVEKYEVEADLPEGHSEEAEEAGAEAAEKGPDTEMPEAPGVEEAEHGKAVKANASGMPMKHNPEHSPIHKPYGSEHAAEMEQAKKEIMDRLSKKPKAVRRY